MEYEFNALNRGLRCTRKKKNPGALISAGTDAFAIHGRQDAQVALLQSPILPAVISHYSIEENFRGLPIDKPHTGISWFSVSTSLPWLARPDPARYLGGYRGRQGLYSFASISQYEL